MVSSGYRVVNKEFGFQKLEIYQLAKELVKDNYIITRKLPDEERYALAQQMNRCAVSIPSNIAEGVSRFTNKQKAQFINISYGSLMELICQMEIALDLKYITQDEYDNFEKVAKILSIKLSNYLRSLRND